ncbi:MAG: hypothetical protein K8R69_09055 [Deltaproteobacteria bacterium]|nr:hypothetical protein [Deltaproteobacteria bacterium]
MLQELQGWIEETYQLEPTSPVADFLIDLPMLESQLAEGHPYRHAEEVLLVSGEDEDFELGLYLHSKFEPETARLDQASPHQILTTLEGVSHLLLVQHRLKNAEGLTQLELELQAEVDKFLFLRLQPDEARQEEAKSHLRHAANLEGLSDAQRETYDAARRLAYRYCLQLEREYLGPHSYDGLFRELRQFYRKNHWKKLQALGLP